jgi:hypothetical protein
MKPRLQTSLGQQLVMTPQLRQAIRLLQMSTAELEAEITEAVETNPLLDWAENADGPDTGGESASSDSAPADDAPPDDPRERETNADDWSPDEAPWSMDGGGQSGGSGSFDDDDDQGSPAERVAEVDTLQDHLLWQLHLSHLSPRDRKIGAALVDALDDDGYLREPLTEIAQTLLPETIADEDEILTVLHQLQRFDPVGVAARSLGECLLAIGQGCPDRRPDGHAGGPCPGFLGADAAGDVLPVETDLLLPIGRGPELDFHGPRHGHVILDIVGVDVAQDAAQRDQPVQGAAVEQVPADARGDDAADGSFAGARGTVDGRDGDVGSH